MVSAACRGQARRVRGCANHESMREFDRDMPGMCACAGAPMMSSAVLRAATYWKRKGTHSDLAAAFLWIARTICISQETLRHFFFDPAQPGHSDEARQYTATNAVQQLCSNEGSTAMNAARR